LVDSLDFVLRHLEEKLGTMRRLLLKGSLGVDTYVSSCLFLLF